MVDTHGFDIVVQARGSVVRKALRGAWKSATCAPTPTPPGGGTEPPPEQRIPQFRDIPPGTAIGPYSAAGGQVEIPEAGLDATLEPAAGGASLTFGLVIQVEVADPPVPAVAVLDLTATVRAVVPIGVADDGRNVVIRLDGLPRAAVTSELTGPDPIDSRLDVILTDYVHAAYVNGSPAGPTDPALPTIPHEIDTVNQFLPLPFGASYTVNTHLEIYDDLSDPVHRITVSRPDPGHLTISLPVYLRIFNVRPGGVAPALGDPMGLETRIELLVAVERPPGELRLRFDTATATVGAVVPAAGIEGSNYTANNNLIPFNAFETLLKTQLQDQAEDLVHGFGARAVAVPSSAQIAAALGNLFHVELVSRRSLTLWGPSDSGSPITIDDVATRILPDALVIAVNAQGDADLAGITDSVPHDREFSIALDGTTVQQSIDAARATSGWADSDLPRRVTHDDTDADIRELDVGLVVGAMRMTGELTVIDAVLGSIDVDATFRADVGLHWEPNAALGPGDVQAMENHLIGDPDVDPEGSVAFWIIAIILAIITWGAGSILIAIVIIVVAAIVTAVASSIGGSMAIDPITGAVSGISGWPPELARVGRVRAVFHDPIDIQPDGLLLAGTLDVLSSCEDTEVRAARSGGDYLGTAQQSLSLTAASTSAAAAYRWTPGDGDPSASVEVLPHIYRNSGAYVAEHQLTIVQPGGAHSRHLALVRIANAPPTVDAGPDIVIDEGEVVTLVGSFWDVEPGDTHESTWNFGDAQATEPGTLTETHSADTRGTTTVEHAWCEDGVYTVTLRVRDKDGGMAVDTRTVTVRNVAPEVAAGPDLYAYPCTVVTLTGAFIDPGWCDTHTASWDFGDCTPLVMAVVEETHEPPAGTGTATAAHTYRTCGSYRARLVVTDDDGADGFDDLIVAVTDVANGSFEAGFHRTPSGDVANGWDGYVLGSSDGAAADGARHVWSNTVVDGGRRAQGLRVAPGESVGVRQQVGANPGWGYQLTVRHTGDPAAPGVAWLGVDPAGGGDPSAPGVVWAAGGPVDDWAPLTVHVTAVDLAITVFLEVRPVAGPSRGGAVWFDAVELLGIQPFCSTTPTGPEPEGPARRACFDLRDHQAGEGMPATWEVGGFVVTTVDGEETYVLAEGVSGEPALWVGPGVVVRLPFLADRVLLDLYHHGGNPATTTGRDKDGATVDSESFRAAPDRVTVELRGARIASVEIDAVGSEVSLAQLCAIVDPSTDDGDDQPVRSRPAPPPEQGSPRALASSWSRTAGRGCCG